MFGEYQDFRIQRNFRYVKVLSLIALILWCLCAFTYLFRKWYLYDWMISHPQDLSWSYVCLFWGGVGFWRDMLDPNQTADLWNEVSWDIIYCECYYFLAFCTYIYSKNFLKESFVWRAKRKSQVPFASKEGWKEGYEESSQKNDVKRMMPLIIFTFVPVAVFARMFLAGLIAIMAGTYGDISGGINLVSYHLGSMLLSHIFLIISSGFLIRNCVLIKREWKANRLLEEQYQAAMELRKAKEEAQKQKKVQDIETSKMLLEECGMQFFIEYYPQLKRLPVRDVTVSDSYFDERQVRLTAAKQIIDRGLSEYALHYILENFSDIFSSEVIGSAKSILNQIENEKKPDT